MKNNSNDGPSSVSENRRGPRGLPLNISPVRRLLDRTGLTDIELAQRCGVTARRFHDIRRGPSEVISERLVDLIGVRAFGEPRLAELLYPEVDFSVSPPRRLRAPDDPETPLPQLAVRSVEMTQVRVAA